jgi:hypothetical protein
MLTNVIGHEVDALLRSVGEGTGGTIGDRLSRFLDKISATDPERARIGTVFTVWSYGCGVRVGYKGVARYAMSIEPAEQYSNSRSRSIRRSKFTAFLTLGGSNASINATR